MVLFIKELVISILMHDKSELFLLGIKYQPFWGKPLLLWVKVSLAGS